MEIFFFAVLEKYVEHSPVETHQSAAFLSWPEVQLVVEKVVGLFYIKLGQRKDVPFFFQQIRGIL